MVKLSWLALALALSACAPHRIDSLWHSSPQPAAQSSATPFRLAPERGRAQPRPEALALIIGVEGYESAPTAEYAAADAASFADYAVTALGVPRERVKVLVGPKARRLAIDKALLLWMKPQIVKGKSEVFVFFSGHGLASPEDGDLLLLPYDGDRAVLEVSVVRRRELIDTLVGAGAASVTMFLDTCYAGATRGGEPLLASARPMVITAKDHDLPPNVTILAAAANDQLSGAMPQSRHGLFSYYLMKGLEGDAAGDDRTLTAAKLAEYVSTRVTAEAAKQGRSQTPQLIGNQEAVVSVGR